MDQETEIDKEELQILLNLLKEKNLEIKYPLYDFDLITATGSDKGYRLSIQCRGDSFDDFFTSSGTLEQEIRNEFPSYFDLLACLLSSGIIQYSNVDDARETIQSHRKSSNNGVSFIPDTNMFYNGFPSQATELINPSEYLIVDLVINEIEGALKYKYSGNHSYIISEMKKACHQESRLLNELKNQKMKKARRAAYIALRDYRNIYDKATKISAVGSPTNDKEENDRILVQSIKESQNKEEIHSRPIILTADKTFPDLCRLKGLDYILLKIPHTIEAKECTSDKFVDLVFTLATIFGFIKVNSVIIYGDFRGKSGDSDMLKLVFRHKELYTNFIKEQNTCRKLMKLGIEK